MENLRKYQTEVTELKKKNNKTEKYTRGFQHEAEGPVNLKTGSGRPNQSSKKKKKKKIKLKKKSDDSFRDIWDNIKQTNMHTISLPEEDRRGRNLILRNNG